MRFVLKEKLFSINDRYLIKDESGADVYQVAGKALRLTDTLKLLDLEGKELASIREKFLSWGPTYEIHRDDALAAVVKKSLFTIGRCHFTVDVPGPDDLEAQGDFFDREYVFRRGKRVVATVSRKLISLADSYVVEVQDDEDSLLVLASAVIIDRIQHHHGE
jgi:uncharacterized protein YxjI